MEKRFLLQAIEPVAEVFSCDFLSFFLRLKFYSQYHYIDLDTGDVGIKG